MKTSKSVVVSRLSGWDFDGGIDVVIQMLSDLKKQYPDKNLLLDFGMEPIKYEDGEEARFEVYYND